MAAVLARVDNRLVHGQVLEAWVPAFGIGAILVVDPELGRDPLQKMVLEGLSRRGLHVKIATPAEAVSVLAGALRETRVLVLFVGLRQAMEAWDDGVKFDALNLGNIHPRADSVPLSVSVYITPEDEHLLRLLSARGVALEARAVPADSTPDVARWLAARASC